MKLKLLITERLDFNPVAKQILSGFCDVFEKGTDYNNLYEEIGVFNIIFIRLGIKIDEPMIKRGVNLRYIVTPTTGLDHIDIKAAEHSGIKILSLKGETEFLKSIPATAELAWGLILSLTRNIPWAFEDVKSYNWDRDKFRGHELSSKRLGILGIGRIGEIVARYGNAFGMSVYAYDPYRKEMPENVVNTSSLEELLSLSEILSIHVPLNHQTETLIGEKQFQMMQKGSWIINTSRGKIIDEEALIRNLRSGHLAGAGLDVIEDEVQGESTLVKNKLILYSKKHQNLIICPHIGGATFESMQKTELFMAYKLKEKLLCDGMIKNLIDADL